MKGIAVRRPYGTSGSGAVYPAVAQKNKNPPEQTSQFFLKNCEVRAGGRGPALRAGAFWLLLGVQK